MGYYLLLLLVITLLCSRLSALSYHSIHWCSISSRLGSQRCYSSINSSGNSGVGEECSVCNIIILTPTQTLSIHFSVKHESVRNKVSLVGHFSVFTIMLYVHFINMSGLDLPGNRNVLMLHSIMISGTRQARPGGAGQGLPTQTGDQCLPPSFHSSGV